MDIVPGVRKILEMYNDRVPNPPPFKVVQSSPSDLAGPAVLRALLDHAPGQSTVALDIWRALSPSLQGFVDGRGDSDSSDSMQLIFNTDNLDAMEQNMLTNAINRVAFDWVSILILPIRASGKTPFSQSDQPTVRSLEVFHTRVLERDHYRCPISHMVDFNSPNIKENDLLAGLEATHIIPFSINSKELTRKYIEMFTGGQVTADQVSVNINDLSNGLLLGKDLHTAFGNLYWGIKTKQGQGGQTWRYYMEMFGQFGFLRGTRVTDSRSAGEIELIFSCQNPESLPDPHLCDLHLAVCRVAHACGAAEVLDELFYHDPDIVGPDADSSTLPTVPGFGDFALPYFERRLIEESLSSEPVSFLGSESSVAGYGDYREWGAPS